MGYNWGQSYLATLVTPQNCTNMLRNLTFVVQFAYFSIRPKKFLFFRATFVTKSNFWLFFEQILSNFLRDYRKIFGKSRATVKPLFLVYMVHFLKFTYSILDYRGDLPTLLPQPDRSLIVNCWTWDFFSQAWQSIMFRAKLASFFSSLLLKEVKSHLQQLWLGT